MSLQPALTQSLQWLMWYLLTSEVCWRWSHLYRWTEYRRRRRAARQSTVACGTRCRWSISGGRRTDVHAEPGRSERCLVRSLRTWYRSVCSHITSFDPTLQCKTISHSIVHIAEGKMSRSYPSKNFYLPRAFPLSGIYTRDLQSCLELSSSVRFFVAYIHMYQKVASKYKSLL